MKVRRLGEPGRTDIVELECNRIGFWWLLRVLKRLPALTVEHADRHTGTDDVDVVFRYRGHEFLIDGPMANYWIHRDPSARPDPVFEEIIAHLEKTRARWWMVFSYPG
ncbi:MAG: hypothetical protein ACOZBW_07085 [Thermodesulfobacteriota bacterium]